MKSYRLLPAFFILPFLLMAQGTYFPPTNSFDWETMSLEEAGFCADNEQALFGYLEETNTDAFLLLKDGKIVIEWYFGDFTRFSPHVWNSAGKSLMAFTAGIAVGLDSLGLDDPVSDYLGVGWTDCPETEPTILLRHQLSMTTGLSDQTGDVFCTAPECLVCLAESGERWAYHNAPYTLLGEVIEAAVNQDLNDFIDERIQTPTGITGVFSYFGDNRIYLSNARAMARFGLLVLNEGVWDGTSVLSDTAYFHAMTNSSQGINPAYGYLWWLNGKPTYRLPVLQLDFQGPIISEAPGETLAALGKDGQIINVVPADGLVVVRMGDNPGESVPVPTFYNDSIWVRINGLRCPTTAEDYPTTTSLEITPNPAGDEIHLSSSVSMREAVVYGYAGGVLSRAIIAGTETRISLAGLPKGILFIRLTFTDGTYRWKRVVHH